MAKRRNGRALVLGIAFAAVACIGVGAGAAIGNEEKYPDPATLSGCELEMEAYVSALHALAQAENNADTALADLLACQQGGY